MSKNLILLVALSFFIAGTVACTKQPAVENNSKIENASADKSEGDAKSSDAVAAPAGIVQAPISDINGNTFKIADKKGKVVMVNLWAIWCGPCVAEMPEFVELQEKYKDKNFEIIGLNTGNDEGEQESAANIKTFADKLNINYTLGYADQELVGEFIKKSKMAGIPQTFLFNRDGQLTNIFTGGGSKMVNSIKENVEKVVNQ